MIRYQRLNKNNYQQVLQIKHELFPESNSDEDYEKYFNSQIKSNYYLILKDREPCGTIGWYDFDNKSKEAFVGWFGVLPQFQKQGIGTKALKKIMAEVKSLNYEYLRVYTDKVVNSISVKLYDKIFDIKEDYTYPDNIGKTNNFVVFSKFLKTGQAPWNNRPLNEDDNYVL